MSVSSTVAHPASEPAPASAAGLRRTPLFAEHAALGARLIDFGGWEMPVHYGSQIDEHLAVRAACGMFDVSHMRTVDLHGPGCRALLRRLLANDVDKLTAPGRALYSCMLDHAGGVIDDLIVYRFGDDDFRLVVNAATADKDLAWIEARLADLTAEGGAAPTIRARTDLAMIAVQGPSARDTVWRALPALAPAGAALPRFAAARVATADGEMMVARTGYTGEDGVELILPAARAVEVWRRLLAAGARPIGLGARDTLRLEAGMHLYGQDMDDTTRPHDTGLGWTVDLGADGAAPRAFIGREAIVAQAPRTQLLGLLLAGGGVLRAHQAVHTAHGDGITTSGTYSPTLKRAIAMARLPLGVRAGDTVEVAVRDKRLPARVVALPFVRQGRILVTLD